MVRSIDRTFLIFNFSNLYIEHAFALLVCGLGYGMISGAFSLINILADIAGPGTVGINGHDEHFVIVSGINGTGYY